MTVRSIDVRDLLGHPGASTVERIDEPIEGLHTELADLPSDAPVEADLLLENVVEGILVSGTIQAGLRLRCARCLREFQRSVDVAVRELFTREPDPDSDDYLLDVEGELDPEPMVRDAVGLELPFAPLCRPDCKGICERCGGDRNLGECTCAERVDPRWGPLQGLTFEE
jgi:DUF177 domain-containing protein